MSTLYDNDIKEDISIAYLTAVASKAGIATNIRHRDVESEDVSLTFQTLDSKGNKFISNLNIQLKSTSAITEYEITPTDIKYKLKVKNYNDLTQNRSTPIILGLLIIPNYENCVIWTIEDLMLNCTMYWISLKGKVKSANSHSATIKIPSEQLLNSESLIEIMNKIARCEDL